MSPRGIFNKTQPPLSFYINPPFCDTFPPKASGLARQRAPMPQHRLPVLGLCLRPQWMQPILLYYCACSPEVTVVSTVHPRPDASTGSSASASFPSCDRKTTRLEFLTHAGLPGSGLRASRYPLGLCTQVVGRLTALALGLEWRRATVPEPFLCSFCLCV